MTDDAPTPAGQILAQWLVNMTRMIRQTMGDVIIDTGDLLRCIDLATVEWSPGGAKTPHAEVRIAARAYRLYIERHHTQLTELTVVTHRQHEFGPVTLSPGRWQLRRLS